MSAQSSSSSDSKPLATKISMKPSGTFLSFFQIHVVAAKLLVHPQRSNLASGRT